jgi:membrane protease YdiL (CAAX protease family)
MIVAVMTVGAVAAAVGWRVVEARGASIWVVMGAVNAGAGLAALLTGRVPLSPRLVPATAVAVGVGAGLVLYMATVAFVAVVGRWPGFAHQVSRLYARRGSLSLPVSVLLAAGLTAPGEEMFWRGLFQSHLAAGGSRLWAAVLAWAAYVAANAASLSVPVTLAAIVGGGAWGLLALWTGGVLASVLCHAVWTGLMIGLPPGVAGAAATRGGAAARGGEGRAIA